MPNRNIFFIETMLQRVVSVFSDMLPSDVVTMINAGNMEEAIKKLNCNVSTSNNIITILTENIKKELKEILNIQLNDNVKARWLDKELNNEYVRTEDQISVRSQIETYKYLHQKTLIPVEVSSY